MYNVLTTELIKLRRSKALLLALLAGFIPAPVRFIQLAFIKDRSKASWETFLSSRQEIMVFGMMTAIILASCFIFGMEYQYNTVSCIFTSIVSRSGIYIGKIITLILLIAFLFMVSAVSNLIFGFITVGEGLSIKLFMKYLEALSWYVAAYSSLTTVIAFISIVFRRFAVSAAIVLGYVMMVFPYHLKGNLFICPFMIPAVTASKIFGTNHYVFTNYFKDITVSYTSIAVFLLVIFIGPLAAGMTCYKKRNAL